MLIYGRGFANCGLIKACEDVTCIFILLVQFWPRMVVPGNWVLFVVFKVLPLAESIKTRGSFGILLCNSFACGSLPGQMKNADSPTPSSTVSVSQVNLLYFLLFSKAFTP